MTVQRCDCFFFFGGGGGDHGDCECCHPMLPQITSHHGNQRGDLFGVEGFDQYQGDHHRY